MPFNTYVNGTCVLSVSKLNKWFALFHLVSINIYYITVCSFCYIFLSIKLSDINNKIEPLYKDICKRFFFFISRFNTDPHTPTALQKWPAQYLSFKLPVQILAWNFKLPFKSL